MSPARPGERTAASAGTELSRRGREHDSTCQCVPCRVRAHGEAIGRVQACTRLYRQAWETSAAAEEISRARSQWTRARQEAIIAEHYLRTAEDRDRIAGLGGDLAESLRWDPAEGL
jgi:hypothetical protein